MFGNLLINLGGPSGRPYGPPPKFPRKFPPKNVTQKINPNPKTAAVRLSRSRLSPNQVPNPNPFGWTLESAHKMETFDELPHFLINLSKNTKNWVTRQKIF